MRAITHYASPLGRITMAADGEALIGLWFANQRYFADTIGGAEETLHEDSHLSVFDDTRRWLDIYFNGNKPDFIPRLTLPQNASLFRLCVWKHLLDIPYGHCVTYGELAKRVARDRGIARMSAQAIGGAVGHNPISIIIPCHRVVGSHGALVGYAGGLDIKSALLALEKCDLKA